MFGVTAFLLKHFVLIKKQFTFAALTSRAHAQ